MKPAVDLGEAVLAHAMWRSGSTWLASRFAASPRYRLFYEPDHEYAASLKAIRRAASQQAGKLAALHHPDVGGGYFDAYERVDRQTGLPLWRLAAPEAALRDVYGQASPRYLAFLAACARAATEEGRVAFLGFCRSGTQHRAIDAGTGQRGARIHLWRDPREQFCSYGWPGNDYFIPGTLLQLLSAPRTRAVALALAAPRGWRRGGAWVVPALPVGRVTMAYRLGRRLATGLSVEQAYALFYLSWLISQESARAGAQWRFSLRGLAGDAALQAALEDRFGISLAGLAPGPPPPPLPFDAAAIEARVERAACDLCLD